MGADFHVSFLTIDPGKEIDFAAGRQAVHDLASRPIGEWPEEYLD
jgi:hypothetical protein